MNKFNIGVSVVIPSLISVFAFAVDGSEKRLMLQIADSYSQCSAYYEVAATLIGTENEGAGRELIRQRQVLSQDMAREVAEKLVSLDLNDQEKVKQVATQLTTANHDAAIENMNNLATSEPEQFLAKLARYRSDCADALADPGSFTRSIVTSRKEVLEQQALASESLASE